MRIMTYKKGFALLISAVVLTVAILGCLGGDEDPGEQVPTILTIDFMGKRGTINPGNMTVWENISGQWTVTTYPNDNNTVYVFINITASDCLEQLERAAELGGFSIVKVFYTTFDSWIITAIDGVENQATGRNWQYWVNGEYALKGADKVDLSEGDVIIWKYATSAIGSAFGYLS